MIDRDLATLVHVVCAIFTAAVSATSFSVEPGSSILHDVLLCLSSLTLWTRESSDCTDAISQLREFMQWFIQSIPNAAFFEIASSTVYEVIIDYPSFLQENHWNAISAVLLSDWALSLFHSAAFDESEPVALAKILLAYAETRWEQLCSASNTENDRQILQCCLLALRSDGIPNVDDEIIYMAVDVWSLFIEEVQFSEDPVWPELKRALIPEALRSIRVRVTLPSPERLATFTQYDASCFASFRSCAGDFLEAAARFLELKRVCSLFTDDIRRALPLRRWSDIEADIFCLNSIISKGGYHDAEEVRPMIQSLVHPEDGSPPLSDALLEEGLQVPQFVCKAVATLFVNIREVLREDQPSLSSALTCLFKWLQKPSQDLRLKLASTIAKLCAEARRTLIGSGPWLCSELESYASQAEHRDFGAYERLFGAVAAIAQACTVQVWEEAVMMVKRLLDLVQRDIETYILVSASDPSRSQEIGLAALHCLANMGMAFRAPEAEVIDVDDEENSSLSVNPWAANEELTNEIRAKVMSLCAAVYERSQGPDELKAICDILKAGYTEDGPGPFVFPLGDTLALLQSNSLSHAGIGDVLSNCLTLLKRNRKRKTDEIRHFALQCLQHVCAQLPTTFESSPSADPEAAALVVDFFRAYLPDYVPELMHDERTRDMLFSFTAECLQCHEILPKTSAAQLWVHSVPLSGLVTDNTCSPLISIHKRLRLTRRRTQRSLLLSAERLPLS